MVMTSKRRVVSFMYCVQCTECFQTFFQAPIKLAACGQLLQVLLIVKYSETVLTAEPRFVISRQLATISYSTIILFHQGSPSFLCDGHISCYQTVRVSDTLRNVIVSGYVTFYKFNIFFVNFITDKTASLAVVWRPHSYANSYSTNEIICVM